ncbi:MAG: hypothetical protein V4714_09410 [Bacteroidota bacterium]
MKKLTLLLVFVGLFIQGPLFAQSDSTVLFKRKSGSEALYLRKIESYRKLRNTGVTLGVIGAVVTVAGIVTIATTKWVPTNNRVGSTTSQPENIDRFFGGVLATVLGIPITTTGAILGGIGARKMKQYNKKLENLSLDFNYTPNQQGFALTYRF